MNAAVALTLDRAVRQLLKAGWTTRAVADALAKQASFGKHDGCTPSAIKALADATCRAMNTENRRAEREVKATVLRSLRASLAEVGVGL